MKKSIEQFNKELLESNQLELERISHLPNLYEAMSSCQNGDPSLLDDMWYKHKWLDKYRNKVFVQNTIKFADTKLEFYLKHTVYDEFCSNEAIPESRMFNDKKTGFYASNKKFEFEDVQLMFMDYLRNGFYEDKRVEDFIGETAEHSLNKLRKYIMVKFRLILLDTYDEQTGTKTRMIDGVNYNVKTYHEEVFLNDMILPENDEGEEYVIDDFLGEPIEYDYYPTEDFDFIQEHIGDILTKNQYENFYKPILEELKHREEGKYWDEDKWDYVYPKGHPDELFNEYSFADFNISELSRMLFPEKDIRGTHSNIKGTLESINKRLNKKRSEKDLPIHSNLVRDEDAFKQFIKLLKDKINYTNDNMTLSHEQAKHNSDVSVFEPIGNENDYDFILSEDFVDGLRKRHTCEFNLKTGYYKKVREETSTGKTKRKYLSAEEYISLKRISNHK